MKRALMIVFILSLTIMTILSSNYAATLMSVKGIYAMNRVDKPIPKDTLEFPNVIGISLRVSWKEIEPENGKFNWLYLDREIDKAKEAGKVVTLAVLPGIHTPDWVYRLGAKWFEFIDKNPYHGEKYRGERATFGKNLRIPVPWDETFLKEWNMLANAVGERYRNAPNLLIIHMTGPNRHSAEMILPHEPEDKLHWKEIGYTSQKLTESWKKCVDMWAQIFPSSFLSLNLAPTIFDDGVMDAVAEYGVGKYGRRFLLQNDALTANPNQRRKDFGLIEKYSSKTSVGFQMLGVATGKLDKRQGDLRESIDHGLSLGAKYFEIYPDDIRRLPEIIEYAVQKVQSQHDETITSPQNQQIIRSPADHHP